MNLQAKKHAKKKQSNDISLEKLAFIIIFAEIDDKTIANKYSI